MSDVRQHEIYKRRGARNRTVMLALFGFVALMFLATLFQLETRVHPSKQHKTPNYGAATESSQSE